MKIKEEGKTNGLATLCGIVLGIYYIFIAMVSKYIANAVVQKMLLLVGSVIIGIAVGLIITYACAPIVSFLISAVYKTTAVKTSTIFISSGIIIIILFSLALKITHYDRPNSVDGSH